MTHIGAPDTDTDGGGWRVDAVVMMASASPGQFEGRVALELGFPNGVRALLRPDVTSVVTKGTYTAIQTWGVFTIPPGYTIADYHFYVKGKVTGSVGQVHESTFITLSKIPE